MDTNSTKVNGQFQQVLASKKQLISVIMFFYTYLIDFRYFSKNCLFQYFHP